MADCSHPSFTEDISPPKERISIRTVFLFAAALLWLIVPIVIFYIFHKPLPPAALERIRDALADLLAAGWMVWIGIGLGRGLIRGGKLSALERIPLSGALGLGLLGLLFLGVAWTGLFSPDVVLLVCVGLTVIVSIPFVREIIGWGKNRPRGISFGGGFSVLLSVFVIISAILSLGIALAPPTAWDALVYHVRIPQEILSAHSLFIPGDSMFREMPQLAEMLFAAAMGLTGRPETAAVLGWGIALLTLLGITGTARRWGLRYSLFPAAILLAGDTLAKSMGWGYVDWVAAFFGFAAMCALSQKDSRAKWFLLAGALSGFAAGTKYTAGILLVALLPTVFSIRGWKQSLKEAAFLLAGFLLTFTPWMLRGLAVYGNPLPPLLDTGLPAGLRLDFFSGRPLENAWIMAVGMPLLQSTIGSYGAVPFAATIGPLMLAFLPGALTHRKFESPEGLFLRRLFWISAVLYWGVAAAGGFFSESLTQPRLYMVLFPGIALLSAYGFERLWEIRLAKIRLGAVAAVLTVLVIAVQAAGFAQSWVAAETASYLAGSNSREEFLEKNLGWYARAMKSARALPEGSRVLMLWEPRGLYCGESCLEDATIDRWYLAMRSGLKAEEILARWREEGWTHILLFNSGADFERAARGEYTEQDWEELERFLAPLPVVERFGEGYTLYSLE